MTRATLLAALLLATTSCVLEEGPMMEPGSNCLECHDGGEAPRWTVAGTDANWARRQLLIQDAAGKTFTRPVNQVGNFWTSEPVTFPLRVSVDGVVMPGPLPSRGNCNGTGCHGGGGGD
jgi:hypothetical protein